MQREYEKYQDKTYIKLFAFLITKFPVAKMKVWNKATMDGGSLNDGFKFEDDTEQTRVHLRKNTQINCSLVESQC